jgi:hypothetical protein
MPIVTLATHVSAISGSIGDLTYVPLGGRQILRRKPRRIRRSAGQNLQPNRVRAAAKYWRSVLKDAELKAFYFGLPHVPSLGAYQHALRDFMHPPVVHEIDPAGYTGQIGGEIRVQASDDTGVLQVQVSISDMNAQLLEQGEAELRDGVWIYASQKRIPAGQTVTISATAKDRPGNSGGKSCLAYCR